MPSSHGPINERSGFGSAKTPETWICFGARNETAQFETINGGFKTTRVAERAIQVRHYVVVIIIIFLIVWNALIHFPSIFFSSKIQHFLTTGRIDSATMDALRAPGQRVGMQRAAGDLWGGRQLGGLRQADGASHRGGGRQRAADSAAAGEGGVGGADGPVGQDGAGRRAVL